MSDLHDMEWAELVTECERLQAKVKQLEGALEALKDKNTSTSE